MPEAGVSCQGAAGSPGRRGVLQGRPWCFSWSGGCVADGDDGLGGAGGPVGRRHPRQHSPRRTQAVPAGDDRRPRRRPQGTRRAGRRLPRVHRVVGRPAARLRAPRHGRPGARRRRRRARFWGALREVFPQTREQRCWFRKSANVLAALPKSAHVGAKKALAGIWGAEDKQHALAAVQAFGSAHGAKFSKAVAKLTEDAGELLAFYDYPARHWVHLRTTNPVESTFATVRHRAKVTKGPGSRAAGLAMAFKLIQAAQDRWPPDGPTNQEAIPKPRDTPGTGLGKFLHPCQAKAQ